MIDRADVAHDTYQNTIYAAYLDGKDEGKMEGLDKGRDEGRSEERVAIARNFLQAGIPVEVIAQGTGLSQEEIKSLMQ